MNRVPEISGSQERCHKYSVSVRLKKTKKLNPFSRELTFLLGVLLFCQNLKYKIAHKVIY
jgi:hypothetical protein